jgi:uncharacterized protein YkwD
VPIAAVGSICGPTRMGPGANLEEEPVSANGHIRGIRKPYRGGRSLVIVFALVTLFASAVGGLWASPAQAATSVSYSDEELAFVQLLNDYRIGQGRQPLLLSDTLSLSADRHSSDMGKYAFFSHRTGYNNAMTAALSGKRSDWFLKGAYPWDRMRASGYNYYTNMGENIAAGQQTAQGVFDDFKESKLGHNEAMLASYYKAVGVSQVVYEWGSQYKYYWTVDFGGLVDPLAHDPEVYQTGDPRITLIGNWSSRASNYASGRDLTCAASQGAAVLVSFAGTGVEIWAKTGPDQGMVQVSLDGGPAEQVDLYNPVALYQQVVYEKPQGTLENKTHTLTIQWIEQKNLSASGYLVSLDAVKTLGTSGWYGRLTQASQPTRHQQEETAFNYTGGWATGWTWSASGGSFSYANSPGASVNVTFDGTYVTWVAKKGPGYGKAAVSLDGGPAQEVDLYSPYDLYKQKVYSSGLLDGGPHTLSIYWVGQKNAAAFDYRINVDTFDMLGTPTEAPEAGPVTWLYEQNDGRVTYLGPWSTRWDGAASAGSFYYTSTTRAAALVNFTGTAVELLAKKGPDRGTVQVSLDGGPAEEVDLYNPVALYQQVVYKPQGTLENKTHTLSIKCTGEKNDASGGYVVDVDALRITGTMNPVPAPTRFQQDSKAPEPKFEYAGAWSTGWTWSASGGSFFSSDTTISSVTVTFDGTYLSWVARTTPWYGIANVTLDGDTAKAVKVDLYSASVGWKRPVYNTGLLDKGSHTLTISWTGEKNRLSVGTAIGIDAVDVFLTTR